MVVLKEQEPMEVMRVTPAQVGDREETMGSWVLELEFRGFQRGNFTRSLNEEESWFLIVSVISTVADWSPIC